MGLFRVSARPAAPRLGFGAVLPERSDSRVANPTPSGESWSLEGKAFGGDPYGTRTRVFAVRGRRPRPLDEGAAKACGSAHMGREGALSRKAAAKRDRAYSVGLSPPASASLLGAASAAASPAGLSPVGAAASVPAAAGSAAGLAPSAVLPVAAAALASTALATAALSLLLPASCVLQAASASV